MVTKTPDEMAQMKADIEAGLLPSNAITQYFEDEARNVFGNDFKRDRHGKPIEQGIGSASHPTQNHVDAYSQYGKNDPDYAENLARMKQALAAYEARQQPRA